MTTRRCWVGVVGGFLGIWMGVASARGEDFSVHLEQVAEIDGKRALPEYKLDRLTAQDGVEGSEDMPRRTYDVYMRFKKFGDLFLSEGYDEGPSSGKLWTKGQSFAGGLCDESEVKAGWIKGSPDLLIVGWVEEHGGGNNPTPDNALSIVQLKDGRAKMLMRRVDPCGIRTTYLAEGEPMKNRRFSWDAKAGMLVERITSWRTIKRKEKGPLVRAATPYEEDSRGLWVHLNETITIAHQIAHGKLVARGGTLDYKAGEKIDLAEVAGFYLTGDTKEGEPKVKPFKNLATAMKALLEANPEITAKFKDVKVGEAMMLDKGTEVRVPLEEKGIVARFAGGEEFEAAAKLEKVGGK